MNASELLIPTEPSFLQPSLHFISVYFESIKMGVDSEFMRKCETALQTLMRHHAEGKDKGQIRIFLQQLQDQIEVSIKNEGRPFFSKQSDSVHFENLGRKGQIFRFAVPLQSKSDDQLPVLENGQTDFRIRSLVPGEENQLTDLFYRVYRYRYINDYVYDPKYLRQMLDAGKLRSFVAEDSKQKIVCHVGLIQWNTNPPVYEAALGVVDPQHKSSGLFSKVFQRVMQSIEETPMQYCVYDFVTNHDFSQKLVAKYGFCDLALFLGNQLSETQAKLKELGLGVDPADMDRYSLLVAIGARTAFPFGKTVILPPNIGEACEFLLKPLNLGWIPAPRFHALAEQGDYSVKFQREQKAIIFDFHHPGRQALQKIIEECQRYLRDGYVYFGVDIPLDFPGVAQIYDILAKHGFFMAGFIPYDYSSRLGFRFQFLLPTKVCFDGIKLHSENGKRLLKMVRASYERNSVL